MSICSSCEAQLVYAVQQMVLRQKPWRLGDLLWHWLFTDQLHDECRLLIQADLPNWLRQHPELGVACYLGQDKGTTIYFASVMNPRAKAQGLARAPIHDQPKKGDYLGGI